MSGIILSLLAFLIVVIFIPDIHGVTETELFLRELPIFRATFMLSLIFSSSGICIAFFREYKVNYVYIFGIVAMHKLNQY
jgi:hypothetical protein